MCAVGGRHAQLAGERASERRRGSAGVGSADRGAVSLSIFVTFCLCS